MAFLSPASGAKEPMESTDKNHLKRAAMGDLRVFLDAARDNGELQVIRGADPHEEISALYELSLQHSDPPVLLFEEIKGYPPNHRVLVNARSAKLFNEHKGLDLVRAYREKSKTKI